MLRVAGQPRARRPRRCRRRLRRRRRRHRHHRRRHRHRRRRRRCHTPIGFLEVKSHGYLKCCQSSLMTVNE